MMTDLQIDSRLTGDPAVCSTVLLAAAPRALDLFCCAGGASEGLHRAGFDVTGMDIGVDISGQCVVISAHEHTEKNQGALGRMDAMREVRGRTMGVAQERQAAKSDMRRLPKQWQRESAASIRRTASWLARREKHNELRLYESLDCVNRCHVFHERQKGQNS